MNINSGGLVLSACEIGRGTVKRATGASTLYLSSRKHHHVREAQQRDDLFIILHLDKAKGRERIHEATGDREGSYRGGHGEVPMLVHGVDDKLVTYLLQSINGDGVHHFLDCWSIKDRGVG